MVHPRRPHRLPKPKLVPRISPDDQAFLRGLVVYEDEALLALNKPSGLSVQGGSGVRRDLDHLLWGLATRKGRKPKLVHRLDRETSGLILVAKTSPAAAHLSAQFAQRTTQKTYLALVCGHMADTHGTIDLPLRKVTSAGLDLMVPCPPDHPDAQQALTLYNVRASNGVASLVEVSPATGRMHQIRAHFSALGHPLAGDSKYGGLMVVACKPCPRLMLHALALTLAHPQTGAALTLSVPPPAEFQDFVEAIVPR
ncbi:ribosomal large subunit pseudouridine synthase C [Candidatus Phycosocius bacilliformis]|uniref:Pseudouridine synthase n=1 Tax=Candidatus Phycosocius bacilliformis TaxID=1445552 RepID=A0A2P2ECN2_9PROT|nr:RluA family pseudouridine synthase [Candidatus Phycosocius bacilliformis]GBF58817.1 ribosomal large subunit pseudouridine synthase C [Candidatus Phycosocius bacilliformis]